MIIELTKHRYVVATTACTFFVRSTPISMPDLSVLDREADCRMMVMIARLLAWHASRAESPSGTDQSSQGVR